MRKKFVNCINGTKKKQKTLRQVLIIYFLLTSTEEINTKLNRLKTEEYENCCTNKRKQSG